MVVQDRGTGRIVEGEGTGKKLKIETVEEGEGIEIIVEKDRGLGRREGDGMFGRKREDKCT
jgi:hypothetical protein